MKGLSTSNTKSAMVSSVGRQSLARRSPPVQNWVGGWTKTTNSSPMAMDA